MQYSTLYNNIAHATGDTSTSAITRCKESANDAYQEIFNSFDFSWATAKEAAKEISLNVLNYIYNLDATIARVYTVWYQNDTGTIQRLVMNENRDLYNSKLNINSNSKGSPSHCFIAYKEHKIMFNYYPSESFIAQYGPIYYIGRHDITELSSDADIPVMPTRLHRKLQILGIHFRKFDQKRINIATFETLKNKVILDLIDEDNRAYVRENIKLDNQYMPEQGVPVDYGERFK